MFVYSSWYFKKLHCFKSPVLWSVEALSCTHMNCTRTGQNNQIALHCVHVCAQLLARTRWSPSEYLFLGHIDGFSVSSHLRMLSYNEILFRIVTNTIQIDKFWCTDTTEGSARERQTSKNRKSMQTQGKLLFITDSIFWRNSNFGVFRHQ